MERISIVIPVYNVQNYLRQCINSVLAQTYPCTEIILIDDGSTDESGRICDEYQKQNNNIVVIHKKNGGLSDARNTGFFKATGKYIFFLDSDDWIEITALETLHQLIKQTHADIAISNYWYQYETHKVAANEINQDLVLDKNEAMAALLENNFIKNFAWGKLYRSELLKNLSFPVGKLFEDVYWTHLVFDRATQVAVSGKKLVYYRQRNDSISYQFNINKIHILQGYMERRKFIEKNYPHLLSLIDENIMRVTLGIYLESLRHFNWKQHKIVVKKLIELSISFQEMGIMSSNINSTLIKGYKCFIKCPTIYLLSLIIRRIRGSK